jgi:hypothetical protein
MFDLELPATEIEIAEAVSLCNAIDCNNPVADVIRKLAFERDRLRDDQSRSIEIAVKYGGIDGTHHKAWVIDQMVRILAGDKYGRIVAEACDGEDGPETYNWDVGVSP